ncbi:hypothetical protein [Phormidesmis sp. 146-33]
MPLPENFSSWEHFQQTLMQVQNRIVREEFNDLGSDWDDDITTSRGSLRVASTLRDADSALETLNKLMFFYFVLRKGADLQGSIYGMPSIAFQEQFTFAPQIRLYFLEDARDVEQGFSPVEGDITFRLTRESPETITPSEARNLASRVRSAFTAAGGFVWKKGRVKVTYLDKKRGYDFRLLVTSEAEGKRIIEQVLDIQSHAPDWDFLTVHESRATFPIVPGNHTVYGKSRRKMRRRPRADVRFRWAELHIHGLPNPVVLVDRTGTKRDALVKV